MLRMITMAPARPAIEKAPDPTETMAAPGHPREPDYGDPATRAPLPDVEETADTRWVIANWAELVERYPFAWIAVEGQEVVGYGATQKAALDAAAKNLASWRGTPHTYFLERGIERRLEH